MESINPETKALSSTHEALQGPATSHRARWWIHLALIGGYLLSVAVMGWGRAAGHAPALTRRGSGLLIVGVLNLAIFGCVFGLAWLASRASRDELLLRWRPGYWAVPLGIGYSVALRLLLAVLAIVGTVLLVVTRLVTLESLSRAVVDRAPKVQALVDVTAMRTDPLYYWLTLTFVSFIVAGLREELWRAAFIAGLRALWPRRFASRAGQIAAVAVAALLFGAAHVTMGPLAMGMAAVLGLGLGLIMVLHRSIWPAVIAHGAFDATSLALIPWAVERLAEARQALGA